MPTALLLAIALIGLALIPLGLPGLWLIVLGIAGYGWLTDFQTITAGFVALVVVLAGLGEAVEAWIGFDSPNATEGPGGPDGVLWPAAWREPSSASRSRSSGR